MCRRLVMLLQCSYTELTGSGADGSGAGVSGAGVSGAGVSGAGGPARHGRECRTDTTGRRSPPPPPECLYTELTMGRRSLRRPCSRYSVVGVMAHFTTRGRAFVLGGKGLSLGWDETVVLV
jgi:hypothetical protein